MSCHVIYIVTVIQTRGQWANTARLWALQDTPLNSFKPTGRDRTWRIFINTGGLSAVCNVYSTARGGGNERIEPVHN